MKNYKNGDSMVGIIIAIFILSFTLIGIINILNFNKDVADSYSDTIESYFLQGNYQNITKKIDFSTVDNGDTFYINKNKASKKFEILTGSINEEYKYINKFGEKIPPEKNLGKTYNLNFNKKIDILKHTISPSEISNLVLHLDAQNINGDGTSIGDGALISSWTDISGNGNNFYQSNNSFKPIYKNDSINGLGGVSFDGTDDYFTFDKNILINNDSDCYSQFAYKEKSYAIVLKTGFDVNSDQVIYEQGGEATGYNFMIHDGDLYAGIHNKADDSYSCTDFSSSDDTFYFPWDSGNKYKSVNLGEILPDSTYFIMIVQDSTHMNETGNESTDDSNNTLAIYLNGVRVSFVDHVDPQPEHHIGGMGAVNEWNVRPWDSNSFTNTIKSGDGQGGCDDQCLYFEGYIGEFISWNHALTKNEIEGVQNYFIEKWLGGKSNIKYNVIETNIKKFNQ